MSENDTEYMWPCFAFLFAFDQHLYFPIALLLFRHLFFKSQSLCFLFYLLFETVFVNCPASSFALLPFAFLLSFFGPYIFLFTPLPGDHTTTGPEPQDQRTTGPEDQDHRTRGPQDQRTRGPQDQSTTGPQDQRTRGPQDQRTTGPGPQDQRTTGPEEPKFLFQGL